MQYELRVTGHGITDAGRVRSKNEDSLLILEGQLVYGVADGMGGVSGGDVSSQKLVQCINEQVGRLPASVTLKDKILGIHQAAVQANEWILEWSEKNHVQGAGTTLVLLVLSREYPWAVNILHAGDSRAYRYRGGKLEQITADHSIEEAVGDNSGQPLPSQFKGLITNAVGLNRSLSLELTHAEQQAGDLWLLCSDGLDKMVPDEKIASILAEGADADGGVLAQRLVDEANAAGGKDNVTVVIVKVPECSKRPKGAPAVPFPGPLPVVGNGEASASDTSKTRTMGAEVETNGSVMVSLEPPNNETDFVTHDGASGRKTLLRWVLLTLIVATLAVVLWNLFSGNKESMVPVVPVEPAVPGTPVVQEGATVAAPGVPLEEVVAAARKSGDWKRASQEVQQADYPATAENVRNLKAINIWYNLVWMEAYHAPDEAKQAWPGFVVAANKVLAIIDRDVLPKTAPWPTGSERIANEFCRRRCGMQQVLAKELNGFCAFNSRRIDFVRSFPGEQVAAAFQSAGLAGRKAKEFDRLLRDANYAVKELERWANDGVSLPVPVAQLESLPDSHIKYCKKTDEVVDQLVSVLRVKPALKDSGNAAAGSPLLENLEQVQGEWRAIQASLATFDPGVLSADEEKAIRHYLERLFRFVGMDSQ